MYTPFSSTQWHFVRGFPRLSAKFHAFDGKSTAHNTLTGRTVWNALLAQIALVFRKQKGLLLVDVVAHIVQDHEFDPVQSVHHAQR